MDPPSYEQSIEQWESPKKTFRQKTPSGSPLKGSPRKIFISQNNTKESPEKASQRDIPPEKKSHTIPENQMSSESLENPSSPQKKWIPKSLLKKQGLISETEDRLGKIRSTINKFTPEKEDNLTNVLLIQYSKVPEKGNDVVDIIFEACHSQNKSITYSLTDVYARLASNIIHNTDDYFEEKIKREFHKSFIKKCQSQFMGILKDEINDIKTSLIDVSMLSSLYNIDLLTSGIYFKCLDSMFDKLLQDVNINEKCLKCGCKMIEMSGKKLESQNKSKIEKYLDNLREYSERDMLYEFKCKILDILELKERKWTPRMKVEKPKKLEDIHSEKLR